MSDDLHEPLGRFMAAVKGSMKRLEASQKQILDRLDELNEQFLMPATVRDCYSPIEAAVLLGKRPFTVREWCRLGRIKAKKQPCGRGASDSWEIFQDEIERIRNHGLLPVPKHY